MGWRYKVVDALVVVLCLPFYALVLLGRGLGKLVPRPVARRLRNAWRRRTLREGRVVSRFIGSDVRRDIHVLSAARIDDGFITGRVRTTNVLYVLRNLVSEPAYGPAEELCIDEMWRWSGAPWGGQPDGTSIGDAVSRRRAPASDR